LTITGAIPVTFFFVNLTPIKRKIDVVRASLSARHATRQAKQELARSGASLYIRGMDMKDGASVVADLTTVGRKSGLPRTVELRFTYHQGGFYASSSRIQGKHWCQNLIHNPAVVISVNDEKIVCVARQVTDEKLRKEILSARSSSRDMDRIVFEMKPRD
jgi:deazaflavin-dependent oxidoreductase (nitroreductase family)